MLLGIVLQVAPKVVGECVFVQHTLFIMVEKLSFVSFQYGFRSIGAMQNFLESSFIFWWQGQGNKFQFILILTKYIEPCTFNFWCGSESNLGKIDDTL